MTGRKTRTDLDGRIENVRHLLRRHHARIEPDEHFTSRVIARLPRETDGSFEWAVRRILPVSVALAVALTIAVLAIGGSARRTAASTALAATPQSGSDPLEWLLEGRQEVR